jgi:hypothetical protein
MRRRSSGLLALALAGALAGKATAQTPQMSWFTMLTGTTVGQEFQEVPPQEGYWPGPLGHPRMENGGFFVAGEFLYMTQNIPLTHQKVAFRGFEDIDGSISGRPNTFLGSANVALDVRQLHRTEGTYVPGFNFVAGWRFDDGLVLAGSWMHLITARYTVTAGLLQRNLLIGPNAADTFMFSPVYNFPVDFAGEAKNVSAGNPGATFGIWNAASINQETFTQRFDQFDLIARVPLWQTECYRTYGLVGPRYAHLWQRFGWRSVSEDTSGNASSDDAAIYSNIVSNNLYGLVIGSGNDWWLGATPVGGFSATLDGQIALYWDFVKERAKYELGDRTMAAQHARNVNELVPGFQVVGALWYYPWEAVQIKLGYDILGFFNTVSSPKPIDFNFGSISPRFKSGTFNFINGLTFGVGITF